MAGFFKKIVSGLDFWDKAENKTQRDSFAQQDEERRKREQEARAAAALGRPAPRSGMMGAPQAPESQFDFSNPLSKMGSQSSYQEPKPQVPDPQVPPQKAPEQQDFVQLKKTGEQNKKIFGRNAAWLLPKSLEKRAVVTGEGTSRTDKDTYLQGFSNVGKDYQDILIKEARARAERGDQAALNTIKTLEDAGKIERGGGRKKGFLERGGEISTAPGRSAMRVPVGVAQGATGLYDLATPGVGTNRYSQKLDKVAKKIDKDAADIGVGGYYKAGNIGGDALAAVMSGGATKAETLLSGVKNPLLRAGTVDFVEGLPMLGKQLGEKSSKGEDINPKTVARDIVLSFGLAGGAKVIGGGFGKVLSKFKGEGEATKTPGVVEKVIGQADTPKVEIAPGVKSTNIPKVATEQADNNLVKAPEDIAQTLDTPVQKAVPEETPQPREISQAVDPRTEPINIPDPSNPVALGKAVDEAITNPEPQVPIATFRDPIQAPLVKAPVAPPVEPQVTDLAKELEYAKADLMGADTAEQYNAFSAKVQDLQAQVDAQGNAMQISDAQLQRQMADQGIAPARGDSIVASTEEELARQAQQNAAEQVNIDTPAPLTRGQITNRLNDEELAQDLMQNAPRGEKINLAEARDNAKITLNNVSDEALLGRFMWEVKVSDPQTFYEALESIKRLERLNVPEAEVAVRNAVDAMAEYASESGRGLRTVQVLFEDMPTTMKVDYLVKKLNRAGVDLPDVERAQLTELMATADNATASYKGLQRQAQDLLDSGAINNESMPEELYQEIDNLVRAIGDAKLQKESLQGEAWKLFNEKLPPGPLGKRVADTGRTLMLSSPAGRVFDVISTTSTTADDIATKTVSNLIGKVLNKFKGAGTVTDTLPSVTKFAQGGAEGVKRIGRSFGGEEFVDDFLGQAKRSTRGDISTGGTRLRKFIKAGVEAPTELTRGIETDELYRQGMKEAASQGLEGDARRTFAKLRAEVPNQEQAHKALQDHMRANMLHDNKISRALNGLADSLDSKAGGWGSTFIRNQVAPFTSWLGGNLHRTLTDKNVLYNVGSAIKSASKGDLQGMVDDIGKFVVNSGEAYAAGMLLTKAGVITDTDANGDSYGGLYFKIGDRRIPIAIAGTLSVPIILGNALEKTGNAIAEGGNPAEEFVNNLIGNTLKNAGVANVFGGDNNLQSTISQISGEDGNAINAITRYGGNLFRQFIPGVTGDINAGLDQADALNPTGEMASTKVMGEDGKTNVLATELAKTQARIPGLAQALPREEGTVAKDFLDRATKGNRGTEEALAQVDKKESLGDMEKKLRKEKIPLEVEKIKTAMEDGDYEKAVKGWEYQKAKIEADPDSSEKDIARVDNELRKAQLQSEGVSITDEGIKARAEEGDFDSAIKGLQYQLDVANRDRDKSKSYKQKIEDEIGRLEVTKEGQFPPDIINQYSSISKTEWKAMGNPESEDYDPEMYNLLYAYDKALAEKGVSREGDGSKQKYKAKGSGKGGSGGKGSKISTSIATNSPSKGSFQPLKAQGATFGASKTIIPEIARVKNYDTSKLKKITVNKGSKPS